MCDIEHPDVIIISVIQIILAIKKNGCFIHECGDLKTPYDGANGTSSS